MFKHKSLRPGAAALISIVGMAGVAAIAAPVLGDWSAPASIQTLPRSSAGLNTGAVDGCASQSPDGLSLFFNSNRSGNQELYVAVRRSTSLGFGNPVALPAPINSAADEACPTIVQGNRLYFSSNREDPAYDLYMTRMIGGRWLAPLRLPATINTPGMLEESAAIFRDDQHREVMLFSRRNLDGTGGKIYQSINGGAPTMLAGGPTSPGSDGRASITPNGRTIYFDSVRAGTLGGPDLYSASRPNTSVPFGPATHLSELSSPSFDARPFISADGTMMTFSTARAGGAPDMWFTSRGHAAGN